MNQIQYISITHISKDDAKDHKRKCNTVHSVYFKEMTFDEVADLLDAGCSFGRVGNNTDFVAIDIDKTTVNINQVYEHYKDNNDYRVSYSASNNPLKYHILVNLHRTITRDEYKDVVNTEFEKIKSECCKRCDFMELDRNADNFYQCFFGNSVDVEMDYVIDNSKRLWCWCKKDEEPKFFIEKEIKSHPSMNSADYCKKNGLLTIKEDKRFDVYLPSMTNGKLKKISEGHRYNWVKMTGAKVLMRILYLNHQFNEGWTKWDFLDTLEWVVRTNIYNPNEFCNSDDYKGLVRFFDNKWDILLGKSFEEVCSVLEPYFDSSKRQYKSRQYNPTVMTHLIQEHQIDQNTVLFTDKEELQDICKKLLIDYYKFINYAKSINYQIVFEVESDKRTKYNVEGMSLQEFNEYCKENNINKVTKSRLKNKYNIQ